MTADIDGNSVFSRAFRMLTEEERVALLEKAQLQSFQAGQTIFEEGAAIDSIYVIANGTARISHRVVGTISAEIVGPRGPGEVLGEMSYIDGEAASATLVADGDLDLLRIDRRDFDAMIAADQGFAVRIYHSLLLSLCERLRATNARVFSASA